MEKNHVKDCGNAIFETMSNRKKILSKAYKEKDGRILATLGVLKTTAIVLGYGVYSMMPEKLRTYDIYDSVEEVPDCTDIPENETC